MGRSIRSIFVVWMALLSSSVAADNWNWQVVELGNGKEPTLIYTSEPPGQATDFFPSPLIICSEKNFWVEIALSKEDLRQIGRLLAEDKYPSLKLLNGSVYVNFDNIIHSDVSGWNMLISSDLKTMMRVLRGGQFNMRWDSWSYVFSVPPNATVFDEFERRCSKVRKIK
ncbi:MAG: hypothetical protein IOC63_12640 [Methylobacterium sp.]|nr:hypothetical protein [Methylobacterium sp.]